jgi:hypothetical protein
MGWNGSSRTTAPVRADAFAVSSARWSLEHGATMGDPCFEQIVTGNGTCWVAPFSWLKNHGEKYGSLICCQRRTLFIHLVHLSLFGTTFQS